jgi:hypothetical protein
MPWGRLDDGLYDHPKLDKLGRSKLPAIGLWTLSISWSNRRLTDGFVPASQVVRLGGSRALAQTLIDAGLFDAAPGGYAIHDFLTFNDAAETVQQRRDQAAERQRRHRGVTPLVTRDEDRDVTRDKSVSHASPAGARARQGAGVPSRPNPVLETPKSPPSGDRVNPRANGTNPRAQGSSPRQVATKENEGRRWRRNQRDLAYARGALTEAQHVEMNKRDAPLDEIPDWVDRLTKLQHEDDPLPAFLGGHER